MSKTQSFKDYLSKKDIKTERINTKTILEKTEIKPKEKKIVKEITETKDISNYSEDELLKELNNRNVKIQQIKEEKLKDPISHASAILEGVGNFSEGSKKYSYEKQDDMMQHVLDLF